MSAVDLLSVLATPGRPIPVPDLMTVLTRAEKRAVLKALRRMVRSVTRTEDGELNYNDLHRRLGVAVLNTLADLEDELEGPLS